MQIKKKTYLCGMLNVAIIGMGQRGKATVERLRDIPLVNITHMCDRDVDWREVVRDDNVELVWICTPWEWHLRMAAMAMECGKDVALEVPAVMTVAECHQLVDVACRTGRHCLMLENCCYDTWHLGAREMVRRGMLGRIKHLEGAYAHTVPEGWMRSYGRRHAGNPYPTHALGPMCQLLNEEDTLDYLVSVSSSIPGDHTNTSLIRTRLGVSMLLHYDISTPRPYNRMQTVCGTLGFLQKYPVPSVVLDRAGVKDGHICLVGDEAQEYVEGFIPREYRELIVQGQACGAANLMNYIMDRRIVDTMRHVLKNRKDGLAEPSFDVEVYDAALWSSAVELTAMSVSGNSVPVRFPSFRR